MSTLADRLRIADLSDTSVDVRAASVAAPPIAPVSSAALDVQDAVTKELSDLLATQKLSAGELRARATALVQEHLLTVSTPLSVAERASLTSRVVDNLVGLGPLEPLLTDPTVTEIMTSGPHSIWVERAGKTEPVSATFTDDAHLRRIVDRILAPLGRRLDESSPKVDARLADGSRVHVIIPPLAVHGTALTIRKFATERYTIEDLVSFGTLSQPAAVFLAAAVEAKLNILIAGGTGAGKTSTLNSLAGLFATNERVITVEDLFEIKLDAPHWIPLEGRPPNIEGEGEVTLNTLVKEALRMRPDRLVVGEIRAGDAAMEMLQAMNTGHEGSLGTVHANSPRDCFTRVSGMVSIAGYTMTEAAVHRQMASAVDLIVFQRRMRDGSRAVSHITEITGMEADVPSMQDIFVRPVDASGAKDKPLAPTGTPPRALERIHAQGVALDRSIFFTGQPVGAR